MSERPVPWTGCSHSLPSLSRLVIHSKAAIQAHGGCSFNMIKGIIICSGILQTQKSRVMLPVGGTAGCVVCRKLPFAPCTGSLRLQPRMVLACLHRAAHSRLGGCRDPLFLGVFRDEGDVSLESDHCLLRLSWNGNFIYRSNSNNRHPGP